jgi:regulator of cell morphogenesis and NO signaling
MAPAPAFANRSRRPPLEADLDALVDHIVGHHHAYVRDRVPVLTTWLEKLAACHGARHPELSTIRDTFLKLGADLMAHLAKEEHLLFPFIRELAAAAREGQPPPRSPFGTILNPVRVMQQDHRAVCILTDRLRALTNGYQPPGDACRTYHVCFSALAEFDANLTRHVHLEDHVLFPRALDLEMTLT